MKSSYDAEADALFLHLADVPTHESQEIAPGVIFDFDENGHLVRIEILDASRRLAPGPLPVAAE